VKTVWSLSLKSVQKHGRQKNYGITMNYIEIKKLKWKIDLLMDLVDDISSS
jgi:hypothetical protein